MCSYMCTFENLYLMVMCACVRLRVHLGMCISHRHIMSIPVRYTSHKTVCIIENSQCQTYLECKANLLISFFACLMRINADFQPQDIATHGGSDIINISTRWTSFPAILRLLFL